MVDFAELKALARDVQNALNVDETQKELINKLVTAIDMASKEYAHESINDCLAQAKKDGQIMRNIKLIQYLTNTGSTAIREESQYPKLDVARDRFSRIEDAANSIMQLIA